MHYLLQANISGNKEQIAIQNTNALYANNDDDGDDNGNVNINIK